jgi:hypothetical protein
MSVSPSGKIGDPLYTTCELTRELRDAPLWHMEAQPLVSPAPARRAVGVATYRHGGRRARVAESLGGGTVAHAPVFRAGVDTAHLYPPD